MKPALAQALWKIRSRGETKASDQVEQRVVLDDLNTRACSHITNYLTKYDKQQFEFVDLDIDKEIEATDPKLWEAICLLTRSTSERKGLSKVNDLSSQAYHTKKIRRFFLLSALLFCINDDYTIPLHTYTTDLIEGQGGSAALVKLLNQFGVCASSDTLARYIQGKVSNPWARIAHSLEMDSFTAVSADNIDFLHSYARHFKGSKNNSWHGTTVQVVQPLPSLSIHPESFQQIQESVSSQQNVNDCTCTPVSISVQAITQPQPPVHMCTYTDSSITLCDHTNVLGSATILQQAESTEECTRTVCECTHAVTDDTNGRHTCMLRGGADENTGAMYCHSASRKRQDRTSPFQSPQKLTRSPATKIRRRPRTGTEQKIICEQPIATRTSNYSYTFGFMCRQVVQVDKQLSDFLQNEQEMAALSELQEERTSFIHVTKSSSC